MTIETNFLEKMSKTNLDNIENMDFVLSLDILNGCIHSCEGCYVRKVRDVNNWEEALERAYTIAKGLAGEGLRFREIILAPTEFFSAHNTKEVLLHPTFQKLLQLNEKTRITAACVFDNLNREHFKELFSILDNNELFREKMILEFLVPLNTKKMLAKETKYMEDNKWALDYFKNHSPKIIDWSYVVNIHNNELLKENYMEVIETIKSEFNTILEFNPGFFRSQNNTLIDKNLSYWKGFLQDILEKNDYRNIYLTNIDKHHNTSNTICLNLIENDVYFSPFIYEQIIDTHNVFKLEAMDAHSIMNQHIELQTKGFAYADKTTECSDCQYLTACVGRKVLNYMQNKGIKNCLFPRKFKDLN
ncbi:hypothetical protein [Peredibacter starrii]|uniref:Radical SAM protein n=1 Tax=Peredibacter starrii TaxID=28202 RepID=A0AAX4HQJ0_9BACT|nr:hypothetical protein [Peredibacter starrii]WPU65623.1 hypothetical protein SOO65_02565 [Peredibacter starrii]